jgi:hypothetical protein
MGIIMMLLGIGLLKAVVLPHMYICPESATCPGSWHPDQGNSLQLLQTFTVYWNKVGFMVSSVGILKLTAYQAWYILMHQGNSVKNLDLNFGAIRGSIGDAISLLFKKNNRVLSIFVFALIGIGAAINLIAALSTDMGPTTQSVMFEFNSTSQFPDSSLRTLDSNGQLEPIRRITIWAFNNDQGHGGALKGTLVTPDARSSQASDILPAGPTIHAWFECQGLNNYTEDESGWYVWVNGSRYPVIPSVHLGVAHVRIDTAVTEYIWFSNTAGLIPNATATSDGMVHMALCTHYYEMFPEGPRKSGVRHLTPTDPQTSGCASHDTNICVADSVNNAILTWWSTTGTAFSLIACTGGILGIALPISDEERYCQLTQELFQATAVAMLDAIIQTAPMSGPSVQELEATVSSLNRSRWWLNVIIPVATLVLYLTGLVYTCVLSQGDTMLKELNLVEVVRAAQTDHVHDLVLLGQLKKTPLRYQSNFGFVDSARNNFEMKKTNT